jgi:hypothetical protein
MSYLTHNFSQNPSQIQYKSGFSQEIQADENIQSIIDKVRN